LLTSSSSIKDFIITVLNVNADAIKVVGFKVIKCLDVVLDGSTSKVVIALLSHHTSNIGFSLYLGSSWGIGISWFGNIFFQ